MIILLISAVSLSATLAGAKVAVRSAPSPVSAAQFAIMPAPLAASALAISPLAASKFTLTPSIAASVPARQTAFQATAALFSAPASLARVEPADIRNVSSSLFDGQKPGEGAVEAGADAPLIGNERGSVFGRKTGEGLFHSVWARFSNRRNIASRKVFGVGGPLTMHRSLARELVEENRLFSIPLFSGMQTPVFDAVEYLAEIKDAASIARIKALFEARSHPASRDRADASGPGYTVRFSWGPLDYLPGRLQGTAAKALLTLMPLADAKRFTTDVLSRAAKRETRISRDAIDVFAGFAIRHSMSELAPLMLAISWDMKARFELAWSRFYENSGISYEDLYGYEDMALAAYRLGVEPQKSEALRLLVDEYNHPDSDLDTSHHRSHDNISDIVLDIVNQDFASAPQERAGIIARLEPVRFEFDSRHYRPQ
ncbi:MAG: hypothetical protein AAB036_07450 [Elusimicrobiota bacterium]